MLNKLFFLIISLLFASASAFSSLQRISKSSFTYVDHKGNEKRVTLTGYYKENLSEAIKHGLDGSNIKPKFDRCLIDEDPFSKIKAVYRVSLWIVPSQDEIEFKSYVMEAPAFLISLAGGNTIIVFYLKKRKVPRMLLFTPHWLDIGTASSGASNIPIKPSLESSTSLVQAVASEHKSNQATNTEDEAEDFEIVTNLPFNMQLLPQGIINISGCSFEYDIAELLEW